MQNKDLKKIYNNVYKKIGEKKFFSKFKSGIDQSGIEGEVKKACKWRNKKVLDFGCGTGRTAFLISSLGAEVHGLDYSKEAIRLAKKNFQSPKLHFRIGSLKDIKDKYDVIISLGTLEHMDKPLQTLRVFKKHLNKKGRIIITCPNWTNIRGFILMTLYQLFDFRITLTDIHYFTPKDIENLAQKAGLKFEKWWSFNYSLGNYQWMLNDLRRRLPKVLKKERYRKQIKKLLVWLEKTQDLNFYSKHSGSTALYILKNK